MTKFSVKGVEILDFHPEDVIISLINIAVLFFLLRLILWKHVNRFLSERAYRVKSERDNADKARLEAEALRSEYDDKLGEIDERGQEVMLECRQKAGEESDKIIKEAREKAREIITDAEARIESEKEQALEDARFEVAQMATEMASRILEREVSVADSAHAVDEFFRE